MKETTDKISKANEKQRSPSQQSWITRSVQKWSENSGTSATQSLLHCGTDTLAQGAQRVVDVSLCIRVPQRILFPSRPGLSCSSLLLTLTFRGGTLFERAANPTPPLSCCRHAARCPAIQNLICKKKINKISSLPLFSFQWFRCDKLLGLQYLV